MSKNIIKIFVIVMLTMFMLHFFNIISSANELEKRKFIEMTSNECYEFIQEEGIEIPDQLEQIPTIKEFIKEILITVENNPTFNFIINYTVTKSLVDDIQSWYLKTYEPNLKLLRSTSVNVLDNSLVYDNGEWKNTGGDWNPIFRDYNCYAYALNIIDNKFNPGGIYDSSSTLSLYEERLEGIAALTKNDIISLGYTNVNVLDYFPNEITENMNVICLRVSDFDFHYMKYDYYTNGWYHKPGDSAILKYNSVMDKDNVWTNEGSLEGNIIKPTQYDDSIIYYNSDIKYIIYEDNGVKINCADKILQSTENILPNKRLIKRVNLDCPNNLNLLISSNSNFNVKIYDSILNTYIDNFTFLSDTKVNFSSNLNFGTYIIYVFNSNLVNSLTLDIEYKVNYQNSIELLDFGENNILNDLHLNYKNEYEIINCLINRNGPGFYKFSIEATKVDGSVVTYPNASLKIYDHMNSLQEDKYSINGYSEIAQSIYNNNYLYMYLERNGYYYIHVNMSNASYTSVKLNIERVSVDEIEVASRFDEAFTETLINSNDMTEYATGLSIDQTSVFTIDVTTSQTYTGNITFILFRKAYNNDTKEYYIDEVVGDYIPLESDELRKILAEGTYYIGFFGNTSNVPVTIKINRIVTTSEITDQVLVMDIDENLPYGTEVRHNGGEYGEKTITEGFTRHVHFQNVTGVPSVSRYDYSFYSSNKNYATVSEFGTVFAKSVIGDKTVTITAVYKYDPAIIFTIELTILDDTSNIEKIIETTQEISLSKFVNGKYKLVLNENNSPYPWIQYFSWSVFVPCQTDDIIVTMDNYGYLTTSGQGSATLTGIYTINSNVTVIIHINFLE